VADWHALTTQYDNPQGIEKRRWTWLSTGWRPVSIPTRRRCSSSPRCPSTPNCTCCCR
jgi:hypothetical protein